MEVGEAIDLGGRRFVDIEPVIRDLRTTLWGFDTAERVLFPGDGFAYSHYHWDGHCGKVAEEAESLDLVDVSAVFAERALYWTTFTDMTIYADRLERLLAELDVVREGLLAGSDLVLSQEALLAAADSKIPVH
jgi:hypothetical protein